MARNLMMGFTLLFALASLGVLCYKVYSAGQHQLWPLMALAGVAAVITHNRVTKRSS